MKIDASEIKCGDLNIKSYIDKKVDNLMQRVFEFMPYCSMNRFNDVSATTPVADEYIQIPLIANVNSTDDELITFNDNGEILYNGNNSQMLHIGLVISASCSTHLTNQTRWMVRLKRINSAGTTVLSVYSQFELPLSTTSYETQFCIPVEYDGGIEKGDKFVLEYKSRAGVATAWSKMTMFTVTKNKILDNLLESSL